MIYRFEDFELREDDFCLTREGQRIALEPKALSVLLVLVARAGRLVEKRSLLELVWADTFVEENTLTRTIGVLRRELGDSTKEPKLIETIPTRGYRFIAPVETLPENGTQANAVEQPATLPSSGDSPVSPGHQPANSYSRRASDRSPNPLRTPIWAAMGVAIIIAAGFAAWHLRPKPPETIPPVLTPLPLTTYRGNENAPSFSPDGNQIAFEWDGEKQNNFDIYVKALGADATPLRLTTDPAPDRTPAWSPDGRTIAFQRIVAPGRAALILIPALGGPERKLAEFPVWSYPPLGLMLTWSADSKWLITSALVGDHASLFRVSVDTGESNQITRPAEGRSDGFPTISPDGKTLLFVRYPTYNGGNLYAVRIGADANPVEPPHQIQAGQLILGQSQWIEGGKSILSYSVGNTVRIPAEGTAHPQPVSGLGFDVLGIAVSQRGDRLAYSVVHGDTNVWRIDLTTKVPQPQRLIASTFRDVYPQYSPDGNRLAFHSYVSGGHSAQIYVSDSEGRQIRQLTFVKSGYAATPHWSPDGRTLAFDSNSTGKFQIYTISADGGKMNQLTPGSSDNFAAVWSRDGRSLYFTSTRSGQNEIWKMPEGGGAAVQVTHNGGVLGVESDDGKTLYFSKETYSGSIWKMPVTGGPEQQLVTSLFRFNFAVTRQGIYYMTNPGEDGRSTLVFYNFASGTNTTLLNIGLPEYGLDVSPDGRYLIYAQLDDPASDLMLVENFH